MSSQTSLLQIEVISKETIKPSTPTPSYLKTFQLSGIDQTSPPIPVSLIFFYSDKDVEENELKKSQLKQFLPEVLTHFYPLAGRINDNETINCNDEGVNFFNAHVKGQLTQVISNPEVDQLRQLLPRDNFFGASPKVLASIQANTFDCGGMAIGVSIMHKSMDAASIGIFLNHWAACTRGKGSDMDYPKLEMSPVFPPRYVNVCAYPPGKPTKKLITKRFLFSPSNIAALRAKCSNEDYLKNPSRVESVSALIWKCATNVAGQKYESVTVQTVANIIVNMRGKIDLPFSDDFVGNSVIGSMATSAVDSCAELDALAAQLRVAIRKIDRDYVKMVQTEEGFSEFIDSFKQVEEPFYKGEVEMYTIASWLRFPLYEIDFGWGAPVWACSASLPGKNVVTLMDSNSGNGVEAWVTLDEEDMAVFHRDPELLSFTSTGPQMTLNP